jgi:hypothetical protein
MKEMYKEKDKDKDEKETETEKEKEKACTVFLRKQGISLCSQRRKKQNEMKMTTLQVS